MKAQSKSWTKVLALFAVAFALMVTVLFLLKQEQAWAAAAALATLVVEIVLGVLMVRETEKIKKRRQNK